MELLGKAVIVIFGVGCFVLLILSFTTIDKQTAQHRSACFDLCQPNLAEIIYMTDPIICRCFTEPPTYKKLVNN